MAVLRSELIWYVFLVIGFGICFAGIYKRRFFCTLTGLVTGYLAVEFFRYTFAYLLLDYRRNWFSYLWIIQLVLMCMLAVLGFVSPRRSSAICGLVTAFMVVYSVISLMEVLSSLTIQLIISAMVGFVVMMIVYSMDEKGTIFITAFIGATIISAVSYITTFPLGGNTLVEQLVEVLRPYYVRSPTFQHMIICLCAFTAAGMYIQAQAMEAIAVHLTTKKTDRTLYGLKNLGWKQLILAVFPMVAFVLPALSSWLKVNAGHGTRLREMAAYLDERSSIGYLIASGLFIGALVFFVWYFDVWTGFLYQLLYLLWIPMEYLAKTVGRDTGLLKASPRILIIELLRYVIYFVILWYLHCVVVSRLKGIFLSVISAVLLYPFGILFLKGYRMNVNADMLQRTNMILWGAIAAGIIISVFLCNPDISTNLRGRYVRGKGALYCHSCGERRKAGYIYCGNCGSKYHN